MAWSMVFEPSGLRACTCRIAAPARQASTPCSTISSGCSGRLGFASLPWIPPVRAQVMITGSLPVLFIQTSYNLRNLGRYQLSPFDPELVVDLLYGFTSGFDP